LRTAAKVAKPGNAEPNVAAAPVASDGADRNGLPRTTGMLATGS